MGVDVFFVISGYVITEMLLREWESHQRISLRRFWRRRFFRLTPALAVVIATTFILTAILLLPLQQQTAYQTGIGALFFVANIVIARNTGGYFDAPAEQNPLLNTWSLSVEEQFYFIFPLLLAGALATVRFIRRFRWLPFAVVGVVAVLSLGLTLWSATPSGAGVSWLNFYSPVTRSWEFAVGSLLAFGMRGRRCLPQRVGQLVRLGGGFGLIAAAFAITEADQYPGPWTLVPVTCALLLLIGFAPDTSDQRILCNPILMRIGDWSYSIYLWHWPLIVFALILGIDSPPGLLTIALLSFLPAVLSYRFVEQPLRNWSPPRTSARISAALGILAVPILLGTFLPAIATPKARFEGATGLTYLTTIQGTSFPCLLAQIPGSGSRCFQSKEGASIDLMVIGDSHAEDLYLGLQSQVPDQNVGYVYLPGWPHEISPNSDLTFKQVSESQSIQTVVLNSKWDKYSSASKELRLTVAALSNAGKTVFVADDRPRFSFHAENCQYEPLVGRRAQCQESASAFQERYNRYIGNLERVADAQANSHLLRTSQGFCGDTTCSMIADGKLLFADNGHLNEIGSTSVIVNLLDVNSLFRSTLLGSQSLARSRS